MTYDAWQVEPDHLFRLWRDAAPGDKRIGWVMARHHLDALWANEQQRRARLQAEHIERMASVGLEPVVVYEPLPPVNYADPGTLFGLPIRCDPDCIDVGLEVRR